MKDFVRFEDKSYGMLDISRCQIGGNGKKLFGSDVRHNNVISLSIKQGYYDRGLNNDWFYGNEELIRIDLSPVQFAEAITNLNTNGVPCTIVRYNGESINTVPELDNKKEVFRQEFNSDIKGIVDIIGTLTSEIDSIINNKKTMTKADKESIQNGLNKINMQLKSNIPFLVKCFDEQIEKSVSHSKSEVEAYIQNKINSLGLQALKEQFNGLMITEREE